MSRGFLDQLGYDIEQEDHILRGPRGLNWHTGECKLKAEDIIGWANQLIGELDLLVVWDFNEEQITRRGGNVREASADRRAFEGVTHLLDDDSGECQVIVLKRVLEARGDFVG